MTASGHRCVCDCAAARDLARARFRVQVLLYRLAGLWVFVSFVGSCVLYALVLPPSWVGAWVWLPILATWVATAAGPVAVFRRLRRRAVEPAAVTAPRVVAS